jgi:hypothetical protein
VKTCPEPRRVVYPELRRAFRPSLPANYLPNGSASARFGSLSPIIAALPACPEPRRDKHRARLALWGPREQRPEILFLRSLSSLFATLLAKHLVLTEIGRNRRSVTPLFATLTQNSACKSFACHTYKNRVGVGCCVPKWNGDGPLHPLSRSTPGPAHLTRLPANPKMDSRPGQGRSQGRRMTDV